MKRYALPRLGDARDKDETIRATVRNSLAKTRPRDYTNETIHDDKDSAIRDDARQYATKEQFRHVTAIPKTMGIKREESHHSNIFH